MSCSCWSSKIVASVFTSTFDRLQGTAVLKQSLTNQFELLVVQKRREGFDLDRDLDIGRVVDFRAEQFEMLHRQVERHHLVPEPNFQDALHFPVAGLRIL